MSEFKIIILATICAISTLLFMLNMIWAFKIQSEQRKQSVTLAGTRPTYGPMIWGLIFLFIAIICSARLVP